jgi:hypothetical protein
MGVIMILIDPGDKVLYPSCTDQIFATLRWIFQLRISGHFFAHHASDHGRLNIQTEEKESWKLYRFGKLTTAYVSRLASSIVFRWPVSRRLLDCLCDGSLASR